MRKHHHFTTATSLLIVFAIGLALIIPAALAQELTLNWGQQVNAAQCDRTGRPVINVTHEVTNDIDSGLGGWWAYDNYNRHIQVWQVGADTFCALVSYDGSFVTDDGPSPGNTDTIAAGITGSMAGGYRATITGTLNPTLRTRGFIGAFNYGCDVDALNGRDSCTGLFNWLDAYFSAGWTFTYEWWGWIYTTENNGTWINSIDGNQGDITD